MCWFYMRIGLLGTLCIGVGWIIGVTISMIAAPLSGTVDYNFMEAIGNTLVFGFPGFVMFMIALILSFMDNSDF